MAQYQGGDLSVSAVIKAGGRELALLFNVEAMDEIETLLGAAIDLTNLQEQIIDRIRDRHALVKVVYALAREGELAAGREADFDEAWLKRNLKPGQQLRLYASAIEAITEGLRMETNEGSEDEEVDVVLAELKKKPTG